MAKTFSFEKLGELPDKPGVYLFLGKDKEVLYVGKATSLRDRVKSYFKNDVITERGPLIVSLMEKARKVRVEETDSVLEALILEARMIKKHQPPHNTKDKSDKSFYFVIITKEPFPRVLLMRERELLMEKIAPGEIKYDFGPFPSGTSLREALRLVRKIFPFRDRCIPAGKKGNTAGKPCFNAQIGLCPGTCAGWIDKHEYGRNIQHLRLFFEGRKSALGRSLERDMASAAKAREFEKAEKLKKQRFAIDHIQDVSLIGKDASEIEKETFRVESFDVAHISGKFAAGVMTVLENGDAKKSDYRKFRIKEGVGGDDVRALSEIIRRRLGHLEWPLPQLFVIDGGKAQRKAAIQALADAGIKLPVVSVVKDERHNPREILGDAQIRHQYHEQILLANSEAHRFAVKYHRQIREKM